MFNARAGVETWDATRSTGRYGSLSKRRKVFGRVCSIVFPSSRLLYTRSHPVPACCLRTGHTVYALFAQTVALTPCHRGSVIVYSGRWTRSSLWRATGVACERASASRCASGSMRRWQLLAGVMYSASMRRTDRFPQTLTATQHQAQPRAEGPGLGLVLPVHLLVLQR